MGSLLVGLSFAKSLAFATGLDLIGVNHIEAHLSAIFLEEDPPKFPFIGLVVSGGHTSLFRVDGFGKYKRLGQTRDDAAGEAFDKVAKLLGLGYPGGPIIDELSKTGNPNAIRFPRPSLGKNSMDFSFSGLKTAVVNFVKAHPEAPGGFTEEMIRDIVSSFQEAVVDVLVKKTFQAAQHQGFKEGGHLRRGSGQSASPAENGRGGIRAEDTGPYSLSCLLHGQCGHGRRGGI